MSLTNAFERHEPMRTRSIQKFVSIDQFTRIAVLKQRREISNSENLGQPGLDGFLQGQ